MMRLTKEREARRWSKAELSRRARINTGSMSRIELGSMRPYDGELRRLARALGWPVERARELLEDVPADAPAGADSAA